jgi:hypothetical protein
MHITIDTDDRINDTDRAILRLLIGDPPPPQHPPAHPTRQTDAGDIQGKILAAVGPRGNGARASAKLPYAQQPGVTATESTPEDVTDPA